MSVSRKRSASEIGDTADSKENDEEKMQNDAVEVQQTTQEKKIDVDSTIDTLSKHATSRKYIIPIFTIKSSNI